LHSGRDHLPGLYYEHSVLHSDVIVMALKNTSGDRF